MRKLLLLPLLLALSLGQLPAAFAQASPYNLNIFKTQSFTATGQTGAAIQLNGLQIPSTIGSSYASGTLTLTGVALTTVSFQVMGSSDNGATYYLLPVYSVASPTTPPVTTVTATASGLYQVNLAGLSHIKLVTSGTFTATSVSLTLTGSPNASISRNGNGGGVLSITSPDNTINIGGTGTAPTLDLNLDLANTWTQGMTIQNGLTLDTLAFTTTSEGITFTNGSQIFEGSPFGLALIGDGQLSLLSGGAQNAVLTGGDGTNNFNVFEVVGGGTPPTVLEAVTNTSAAFFSSNPGVGNLDSANTYETQIGASAVTGGIPGVFSPAIGIGNVTTTIKNTNIKLVGNVTGQTAAFSGTLAAAAYKSSTYFVDVFNFLPGYLSIGRTGLPTIAGSNNFAFGLGALALNVNGAGNFAAGAEALHSNTTGVDNFAAGFQSLRNNTTGYQNEAIGYGALLTNKTGYQNVAIGDQSQNTIDGGLGNISLGHWSLLWATGGNDNIAIGRFTIAGSSTVQNTGTGNIAIGSTALNSNTSGGSNVAIGQNAMKANSTASNNVAIGNSALLAVTTASQNVAIGGGALQTDVSSGGEVAVGQNALNLATGANNTAVGFNSLLNDAAGNGNVAVGYETLQANTTGNANSALGQNALLGSTTGSNNVAIGSSALAGNTSGQQNEAIGGGTLLVNGSGSGNVAVGYQALNVEVNASNNTALGFNSLLALTTGSSNIGIGFQSGQTLATGTGNILLGFQADAGAATNTAVQIGTGQNTVGHTLQMRTWNLFDDSGNLHANLTYSAIGAAIASASTIAPTSGITHITGTGTINTITVPTVVVNGGSFKGCVKLIPDAIWNITTAGNVAQATSPTLNRVLEECYDGTKWYPSY